MYANPMRSLRPAVRPGLMFHTDLFGIDIRREMYGVHRHENLMDRSNATPRGCPYARRAFHVLQYVVSRGASGGEELGYLLHTAYVEHVLDRVRLSLTKQIVEARLSGNCLPGCLASHHHDASTCVPAAKRQTRQ